METWKPTETIISHWRKVTIRLGKENEPIPTTIPLKLIRTEKVSDETGKVKRFYAIQCPLNPLPVKGEFETELRIIVPFLKKEGFIMNPYMPKEVIRYVYK